MTDEVSGTLGLRGDKAQGGRIGFDVADEASPSTLGMRRDPIQGCRIGFDVADDIGFDVADDGDSGILGRCPVWGGRIRIVN